MKKQTAIFLLIVLALQLVSLSAFAADAQYNYHATITVEYYGTIIVELYPDIAPATVENFVNLANQGFYDGLTFHRVISGFVIQGGDPLGTGTGGSSVKIKGEFSANGVENNLSHTRGVVSMARASSYDSASSQFFIMHQDATYLDGQHAAFGRVISGMEVVDAICRRVSTTDGNGTVAKEDQPVITSVTVIKNQISTTDKGLIQVGDYEYKLLANGTISIVSYNGAARSLTIPTHLNGFPVSKIDDYAFYRCNNLRYITIPESIVAIGNNPFYYCNINDIYVSPDHPTLATIEGVLFYKPSKRLVCYPCRLSEESYTIPYGVQEIGDSAFAGCDSLEEVIISDSVTIIGAYAFEWCDKLNVLIIPDNVIAIGDSAFLHCQNLTSVILPNSLTSIGAYTFYGCTWLESVTIPNSVINIDETAFEVSYPLLIVERNSYARQYAIDNDLSYNYPDANDWLLQ